MVEIITKKQLGYFGVTEKLTNAGLDHFLLSNGDLLVLPVDSGHCLVRKPPDKLPKYDEKCIDFVIESMGGQPGIYAERAGR